MGYPAPADLVVDHLYLGTFSAVDEEIKAIQGHDLAGRVAIKSRYGGVISKDGDCEHKLKYEQCSLKHDFIDANLFDLAA